MEHTDDVVDQVDRMLRESGLARPGDLVVIAAGSPAGTAGSTNNHKLHRIVDRNG